MEAKNEKYSIDINGILENLPHRYPFLLLDRILECKPGESIIALKNISYNEPYFTGHFPKYKVFPGVLILEAMAQASGILAFQTVGHPPEEGRLYYFVGVDNARFKQPVVPGDQLILDVVFKKAKRGIWKFEAIAKVDENVVCSADIMCAERDA